MVCGMKLAAVAVILCFSSLSMFAQCGFVAEPVSGTSWYRSDGWQLPGVRDGRSHGPIKVTINGQQPSWPDGVTVSELMHGKNYRVRFPAAVFRDGLKTRKMRARMLDLYKLVRWDINGKPFAYSYLLHPDGHLCVFSVDLIDDKGDGIFRVMVTPGHALVRLDSQPPALPEWAKKPTT